MRTLYVGLLMLSLATQASAEEVDFSYTGTGKPVFRAYVKFEDRLVGATSTVVSTTSTRPNGDIQSAIGICQSWTPDPQSGHSYETVCNYSSSLGTYATIDWCPRQSTADCSGSLIGMGAAYKNMTGSFVVHTDENPDGTRKYTGSGHWD